MKIDPRQRTLDLEVGCFIPQPEDFTALRNLISKVTETKPADMRCTPEKITALKDGEYFVFGSNLDGRHGKGAALTACKKFGAIYGVAEGLQGRCYALPTVGRGLRQMPLKDIKRYVETFLCVAGFYPGLTFLVTPIGCGLAGYTPKQIAPFFRGAPENVILPKSFHDVLDAKP